MSQITFKPHPDFLLLQLDVKARSRFAVEQAKPKVLPSGRVVAVVGDMAEQWPLGSHLAVQAQALVFMPIEDRNEEDEHGPVLYALVHKDGVLGAFENATRDSTWFKDDADPTASMQLLS